MKEFVIVGNVSDDPFALDIGHLCGQPQDIADLISLKVFANTEFCPRFIVHSEDFPYELGKCLNGLTVVICSAVHHPNQTRNALALRTCIIARAAKENGAQKVILVEPDLFFSAQDRGSHPTEFEEERGADDLKKFDGQPFTALLYAELLKTAGVDVVVTVHNHSANVERVFSKLFGGNFYNLQPHELYADYLRRSDMVVTGKNGNNLVLCAPDKGAVPFTREVLRELDLPEAKSILMTKERAGEREVSIEVSGDSECRLEDLKGKDVIVLDDMVRTGSTIIECCRVLARAEPNRICFGVTHFHSSRESRVILNDPVLHEILTLNTIPSILNKDMQGRLRKKIVVLKIEKWIARFLLNYLGHDASPLEHDFYAIDMSSKNPRWRPQAIF